VVSKALALLVALVTLVETSPAKPLPESDSVLAAGIALVKEGDFEGAVIELDAAVRQLQAQGAAAEVARAYLYLGVAYLELDQEALARGKFAQALTRQPVMRLDPREFSAQVIRTFEATRQAMPPVEPARDRDKTAAGVLPTSGEAAENRRKRRSALPFILLGGAAAAGGVTLASKGGSSTTPTPAPSSTPTPLPAPSPTPTPPPPAACTFKASPSRLEFKASGGNGTCRIDASRADCAWNAEAGAGWIQLTGGTPGRGDGSVSFTVRPNPSDENDRRSVVRLRENRGVACEVRQDRVKDVALPGLVAWASDLTVPGGSGKVVVDGAFAAIHGPGHSQAALMLAAGAHRFEAVLTSARSQPGVWRFRFSGAFRAVSLRVVQGDAVSASAEGVVFRLRGMPGERVAFTLIGEPPASRRDPGSGR